MSYVCGIVLLMFTMLSVAQNKKINSPLNFLNILFSAILIGASLGLFGMSKDSDDAALIVALGMLFLNIGFYVGESILKQKQSSFKPSSFQTEEGEDVNHIVLALMFAAMVYFSIYYIFQTIQLFARGYSLNMVRMFYFNHDLMEQAAGIEVNGLVGYGTVYLYTPIQHVFYALTALIWFYPNFMKNSPFWRKSIPIVSVLNIVVAMLTNGGRLVVYYLLICILMTFVSKRKLKENIEPDRIEQKKSKKGNRRRTLIIFASFGVLFYIAYRVSQTREEGNAAYSLVKSIYMYFCGCIPNLQVKFQNIYSNDYSYGVTLVSGLIRPIFTGLRFLLGVPIPGVFVVGDSYLSAASHTDIIGEGMTYNAFVTMFYFFYRDLGFIGIVLESFIAGMVFSMIYNRAGFSAKRFVLYLILMQGVSMAFIRWQIMSVGYAISFYYAMLLFSRNRVIISFGSRKRT